MPKTPTLPECLRPLSPEEMAKVPRLTQEQIDEALREGGRLRDAANEAMRHRVIRGGW